MSPPYVSYVLDAVRAAKHGRDRGYNPEKPGGPGYWQYPTRSDAKPGRDFASSNAANYYADGILVTNDGGAYRRRNAGCVAQPAV